MLTAKVRRAIDFRQRTDFRSINRMSDLFFKETSNYRSPYDFLALAVINRAACLTRAFCDLMRTRNFLAAAPLTRIHLDSALRLAAPSISGSEDEVIDKMLRGARLDTLTTHSGVRLTDGFLVRQLARLHPWVAALYETASGYVHLSVAHVRAAFRKDAEGPFSFKVSDEDLWVSERTYLSVIKLFGDVTRLIELEIAEHCKRMTDSGR